MSLAQDLLQVRASLEAQLTTPVLAALERSRESRRDADGVGRALDVGERAPDFELRTSAGDRLRSADLLARGPLVLAFSRGAWCPYCATELQYLEMHAPEARALGAEVLAVSPDPSRDAAAVAQALQLGFPVGSDADNEVARRFGLPVEQDDPLRRALTGAGRGDARAPRELPTPALYVLDRGGVVRFAYVSDASHLRAEPGEWLRALRRI